MSKIFSNPNQFEAWVEASQGIGERFGIDKALGYVIGDKFYNLVAILHVARTTIRLIDEERKKPDYNPIREKTYGHLKHAENLYKTYERRKEIIAEVEELLVKFATLIKQAFQPYEIRKYFESNPRLGEMGHIASEEEYDFMVSKGAVEYSLETEIEDAMIFGEMMKRFQISLNNP
jgi:hypothetical protein